MRWMEDYCSLYALVHCAPAHWYLVRLALAAATAWLCIMQQVYNTLALCIVVDNAVQTNEQFRAFLWEAWVLASCCLHRCHLLVSICLQVCRGGG